MQIFRLILQVSDLQAATSFYETLLATKGRSVGGGRVYFDCGPVILALLDPSMGGEKPVPIPDYIYFAVEDIDKVHSRASELGCLSKELVHGEKAGQIIKRPWGELSFYVEDPWQNGLCFVDEKTLFQGNRV
jgi:predicted enzyme related to lactoylglutathione lyase